MPLSTNLVAAWELNESSGNALDSVGSNTLTDTNTVGSGTGLIYGTARDFEADNAEVFSRSDNTDLSLGDIDYSFEMWIKPESTGGAKVFLARGTGSDPTIFLFLNGSNVEFRVWSGAAGAGQTTRQASTFGAVSTGSWYQVIATYDAAANQMLVSVNDVSDTASHTGGSYDDTGSLYIGGDQYSQWFDGLIGPVRFWKRVLTGAERTELYNSGSGRTLAYITGGATASTTLIGDWW